MPLSWDGTGDPRSVTNWMNHEATTQRQVDCQSGTPGCGFLRAAYCRLRYGHLFHKARRLGYEGDAEGHAQRPCCRNGGATVKLFVSFLYVTSVVVGVAAIAELSPPVALVVLGALGWVMLRKLKG